MESTIIISERNRPIWQIPIAALCFTAAVGFLIYTVYTARITSEKASISIFDLQLSVYLSAIGVSFCSYKRIYVDIENSKFKPTVEVGPIKIGTWKQIKNYEYVSVFCQPLADGNYTFEVNLWYDKNKHFELYQKKDYTEAFSIGYNLSEQLNIDLLDATVPNDYKWIDKDEWRTKIEA